MANMRLISRDAAGRDNWLAAVLMAAPVFYSAAKGPLICQKTIGNFLKNPIEFWIRI